MAHDALFGRQQLLDIELEEEDGPLDVETGSQLRVHLADDARSLFASLDGSDVAAQEGVLFGWLELGIDTGALENLLEDALRVEEVQRVVRGLTPASDALATNRGDDDLSFVRQLIGAREVGARRLEERDGATLTAQVGRDRLQQAGAQ